MLVKQNTITKIKNNLGSNYYDTTDVLSGIYDDVNANALFISNRTDNEILETEIIQCCKSLYLQRGVEDTSSLSESGKSSTYIDAVEKMRNDIIKNGKRRLK